MRFSELIPTDGAPTAADFRAALERAQAEQTAAGERIAALNEQRTSALLRDAADRELDKLEADVARATRDRDRARLATKELHRRLAAAEEGEHRAALDVAHAQGVEAQRKAVALIKG